MLVLPPTPGGVPTLPTPRSRRRSRLPHHLGRCALPQTALAFSPLPPMRDWDGSHTLHLGVNCFPTRLAWLTRHAHPQLPLAIALLRQLGYVRAAQPPAATWVRPKHD